MFLCEKRTEMQILVSLNLATMGRLGGRERLNVGKLERRLVLFSPAF